MAVNPYLTAGLLAKVTINATATNIGKISNINFNPGGKTTIDTTGLEDTSKTKINGIPDLGTVTLDILAVDMRDAAHKYLWTQSQNASAAADAFTIVDPSNANNTLSFSAYVQSFNRTWAKDAPPSGQVTLDITGSISQT